LTQQSISQISLFDQHSAYKYNNLHSRTQIKDRPKFHPFSPPSFHPTMEMMKKQQQQQQQAMWLYPKLHGFNNPSQRWGHSSCYSNGALYIFGGCCGGQHLSDVQKLNMATMSWTTLETTGPNPGPRDSHSAVILGTQMVVFGGSSNNGSKKVNHLHILDLDTNRWFVPKCKGSPPSPRESHTATLIDGCKMVVFGGSGEGEANYLNDVHVLDLKEMSWNSLYDVKGEVPVSRDSHSAVGIDGNRVLVFGGDRGDRYHGDVDVLDMDTLTWSKLFVDGCCPGVRAGHAAVSIGSKDTMQVLVIGGVGDKHYYNDVWMLETSSPSWTRLDVGGHQPQGRFSHTAVVTDSDIAIYGGCGEDERPLNELLILKIFETEAKQGLPFWLRSGVDTMNPKRKRSTNSFMNTKRAGTDQEEHSLSLSQHSSSPSQSDQEQTPLKKQASDSSLASLFQQLNPQPAGSTRGTPYNAQMVREQLLLQHHKQAVQQKPNEQNLIGAEVRGRVDGLFDSGLLMTANVNGRILRGVLFPAAPMVGIEGSPLSSPSLGGLSQSALASRSENQSRNRLMLLSKRNEEAMAASRRKSRVVNRRGGYYGVAESRGSSSTVAESGTMMLKRDHLEGVVLTLGGPGT
ncbi:RING finger protein B, partial [Linum perenne]